MTLTINLHLRTGCITRSPSSSTLVDTDAMSYAVDDMPEKPPSIPKPEDDFVFTKDIYSEEFETSWTPAMRKRILVLLDEVGWPLKGEPSPELIQAFVVAYADYMESIFSKDKYSPAERERTQLGFESVLFGEFTKTVDLLRKKHINERNLSYDPQSMGNTLLRMKQILHAGV